MSPLQEQQAADSTTWLETKSNGDCGAAATKPLPVATTLSSKPALTSAPPPWHSVVLIGLVSAGFVRFLPSWDRIDRGATLSTFARSEAWIGSPWRLGLIRLTIATAMWAMTLRLLFGPGWTNVTKWGPTSGLQSNATIRFRGIKTMFPFTSWCWNLLGLSYSLNALIALCVATGRDGWIADQPGNWLLRLALIVWEIAAPCALLVSTVIRYAIWEMDLKRGKNTKNLKSFRNVMMHNANSFFVLAEVGLLGGLPVRLSEVSLVPLFGVAYVFFTWFMSCRWTDPEHGPQFIYFFFDTTLGKTTSLSLLALLSTQLVFYVLFVYARTMLDQLSRFFGLVGAHGGQEEEAVQQLSTVFAVHVFFVVALCGAVCRFRD